MHERQTALTGAILALALLGAAPAQSAKDAATKAQEGELNHWIEYYRKAREPAAAPPSARQNAIKAEEGRERREEERSKVKDER